jgi:hypothetical protein
MRSRPDEAPGLFDNVPAGTHAAAIGAHWGQKRPKNFEL